MEILLTIGIVIFIIAIWLNILATLAIKHDHTLEKAQKMGQLIFVWLIPVLGASFVLHLVFDHSPDVIPRSWIPWPFKGLIYGKAPKPNQNKDEREPDGSPGEKRSYNSYSSGDTGDD